MRVMEFGSHCFFGLIVIRVFKFPYELCVASNFSQEWERGTQGGAAGEGGRERGREI